MKSLIIRFLRKLTTHFIFKKSLPSEFGSAKIFVSSRSDIRMLAPGLKRSANDLFLIVSNLIKPNDIVWDIGSNLGILTFSSAIKVGRNGKVFSLEADPKYSEIQTKTLSIFNCESAPISILCAAVSDRIGILDLIIPKKGHSRNHLSIVTGNSAGEKETSKQVVTLTLDWLLDYWDVPDFIKIDVEGAELLTTSGAGRVFLEIRPIAYIECSAVNQDEMTKFFKEKKYRLFSMDNHGTISPTDKFVFNTIVMPEEKCPFENKHNPK